MSFTHLHVHSEYSLLDGLAKIDDLLDVVVRQGMGAVALTDHGAMYGAFQFYLKARDRGVKPIIGTETYLARESRFKKQERQGSDQFHLVLLAKNYTGYRNLMKLVTRAHLEGYHYKPRVDFDLLKRYHEGIIALSGCLNGLVPSLLAQEQYESAKGALTRFLDIFGEDFYLELQRYPKLDRLEETNKALIKLSRSHGVPLVATNDVHYLTQDDAYAQEILLCIQTQHTMQEKKRPLSMIDTPEFYLKSQSQMKGLFLDVPEAIENTQKIADSCRLEIPYGSWILPEVEVTGGETEEEYLARLVRENINNRFKKITSEIKDRVKHELDIITRKGYATYFLVVSDFVNWAKEQGIAVGPGRGSVAGSLVAYILRITDINPLEHNLPFERFLNPDRPTPPDIDIDFADTRRDEVLQYVTKKYGEEKVAQIITFGRMEARLAVRDVARALGMSYTEGDRLAKMIPAGKQGFAMTIDKALEESPPLKLAYQNEDDTKRVLDVARKIEGLARHPSVHAAGVVIADRELTDYVPLQKESRGNRVVTQYDMYSLDLNAVSGNRAIGLLKIDFLGLRNLTILENAIEYAAQATGRTIRIENIPTDDAKTFNLISEGRTIGIFQLESQGMRRLARDLKPSKLSDISAMVALYRPGPMELIPIFLEGKKHMRKIRYLHEDLKPILQETYGVLVYQEQVMDIAHQIAGYSMSEADTLRMAMGKKKKALMKEEKKKFGDRCVDRGYTKNLAEQIFGFIEKFAGYGFNKPHSASYGLIAYWTGYMKANYPVEYMTALLSAELQGVAGTQREIKMLQAIEECRAMEIEVLPPDIDKSDYDFKIEDDAIRFGLSAIKNVGRSAIESIVEARESGVFGGLKDFLMRVDVRRVNKKTIESLIKAGALDRFGQRAALLIYYPQALSEVNKVKTQRAKGQYGLFSESSKTDSPKDELPQIEEFTRGEELEMERAVLGFSLSQNPLAQFDSIIKKKVNKKIGDITVDDVGQTFVLAGNIGRVKKINTKKDNAEMAFVTIFDQSGAIEAVVFPRLYDQKRDIWSTRSVLLLKGRVSERDDRLSIVVDNAVDLSRVKSQDADGHG